MASVDLERVDHLIARVPDYTRGVSSELESLPDRRELRAALLELAETADMHIDALRTNLAALRNEVLRLMGELRGDSA